ncbi:DUF393 domain-containing protein [bacterium BMS3Abin03]|nr:DUF393 domain-containing protein [bacterium BMS3Abin03]MCG6959332.1 DUF393 domain-containing protein [bacterium BMS3Abin03]
MKKLFRFTALQSEPGKKLLCEFGLDNKNFDTFILIEDKTIYTRSTTALKIAKGLSSPFKVLFAFIFLPEFLRDLL